jgi:hypothetical protein
VVWVPTPYALIEKMLDMAQVTPQDYVMDLGSGDGRNIIMAAKRGAKALGVEYNPEMVALSRRNAAKEGVATRRASSRATCSRPTSRRPRCWRLFLLPDNLRRLTPKFQSQLKPGTRLVMNGFPIPEWAPDVTEQATGTAATGAPRTSTTRRPRSAAAGASAGHAALRAELPDALRHAGKTPISDARLKGEEISFTVGDTQYVGRVNGNAMSGETKGRDPGNGKRRGSAMIIDIHGHYTTEPPALHAFRDKQLAGLADSARKPSSTDLGISDETLVKSVQPQLKFQTERGGDLTLFSPRAGGMAHHVGTEKISLEWSRICNDLIHRICRLLPDNFVAVGSCRSSRRVAEELHPRARAPRERARLRRREPEPRSLGRHVDRPAAHRPALVPDLREAVRARRAGDDPRVVVLQPELPPHRRALHQRRHHRLHAAHPGESVQGFPDAALRDSLMAAARRRTTGAATGVSPRTWAGRRSPSTS